MKLEFITHVYAEKLPDFAKMFTAQLSSLYYWSPKCEVQVSVCTLHSDMLTQRVCREFGRRFRSERRHIAISKFMFTPAQLFNRAYGRNQVAKQTTADVVWFCDADYIFGSGCLDALGEIWSSGFPATLIYPRHVMIHNSHKVGDAEIAKITPGNLFTSDLSQYHRIRMTRAIGGIQIVTGETARKGYLDGKWGSSEATDATDFQKTLTDVAYHKRVGKDGKEMKSIMLPNLYRMRHLASAFETRERRLRNVLPGER